MHPIMAVILKQIQAQEIENAFQLTPSRPNSSLRLKGLAQARQARSGEPPLRLGEDSKKTRAWATRDLA